MTIVTGNLTLPNQLTPQGWLAQFFSVDPSTYGMDAPVNTFHFEVRSPPANIFGFSDVKVTLSFLLDDTELPASQRVIDDISITNGVGETMTILLVVATSAQKFFDTLNGGDGAKQFYESLQPHENGFFSHTGSVGDDFMEGFVSDDTLIGLAGNDNLRGGGGDDVLDGGDGIDTAVFTGNINGYSFRSETLGNGEFEFTLTDRRPDGNGTDTLTGIELLDFDVDLFGAPFDINTYVGITGLSVSELSAFIELYIAYFDRAPDAIGLLFWGTAYANGTSLQEMAALFIDQDETRATYDVSLSNTGFATAVYGNVLGREGDKVGFDFWVGVLDSGAVTRDQFILSVLQGAKADPPANASAEFISQQLADQTYLSTKTDIGAYYSLIKGMSNVDNAKAAMAVFDGTTASLDNAVTAIDGYYQSAISPTDGEFVFQFVGVIDDPFAQ